MKLFIILLTFLSLTQVEAKMLEIYFDTPELFYLNNDSSLKYQAIEYNSKKNKVKYHENIIYTYDINKTKKFKVKHYNSVKYIEEKHPLLSLIKRKERDSFIKLLQENGLDYPLRLKYILEVSDSKENYKELFERESKNNYLFSLKIQYPYLVNLFYAILVTIIGAIIIYILFGRRLKR